jgi:hypothetical protein
MEWAEKKGYRSVLHPVRQARAKHLRRAIQPHCSAALQIVFPIRRSTLSVGSNFHEHLWFVGLGHDTNVGCLTVGTDMNKKMVRAHPLAPINCGLNTLAQTARIVLGAVA